MTRPTQAQWPSVPLGNLCEISIGKTPARANGAYWGEGHPWLSIKDMNQGRDLSVTAEQITDKAVNETGIRLVPKDTLVMSFKLSVGKLGFTRVPMFTNEAIAALKIRDENILDPYYLYHALNNMNLLSSADRAAMGATLNKEKLKRLLIELPPQKEQKRIAAILDKADSLRRKRQQAIQLADQFLRAVFLDMFGDPVTNPKGLPKRALGELIKVTSGRGLTAKQMDSSGGYAVYGGNGINGWHSEYLFEEPQIAIGRVGVYCGAIHITQPKSWITDNALYVKEYKAEMNRDYLADSLRIANLNQHAGQAAQPLISGGRIYPVEILVPSIDQQARYADVKSRFLKTTKLREQSNNRLECLFSSLQNAIFSSGSQIG